MKKNISRFRSLLILFSILLSILSLDVYRFLTEPLNRDLIYRLPKGEGLLAMTESFYSSGILKTHLHEYYFVFLLKAFKKSYKIKAGEYEFKHQETIINIIQKMLHGDVIKHHITFQEGWTFAHFLKILEENPFVEHTFAGLSSAEIMEKLGYTTENPEGQFFPDTYVFTYGTTDQTLLKQAHERMHLILDQLWPLRDTSLPYTHAYQALIAASLIEKETHLPQERSIVSGVIVRRLNLNMRLQIDASVIYGLGEKYQDKLLLSQLHLDTPYNTYMHPGLPPTPIACPSKASLEAALHPDKSAVIYYVARGDGGHYFSSTIEEHRAAIAKYHMTLQQRESLQPKKESP